MFGAFVVPACTGDDPALTVTQEHDGGNPSDTARTERHGQRHI